MGNTFTYSEQSTPNELSKELQFFSVLKGKYIEMFFDHLRAIGFGVDTDLAGESVGRLSWRDYSQIFSIVKDQLEQDEEYEKREVWHPATIAFEMIEGALPPVEEVTEEELEAAVHYIPDDFTDDDASDTDDEEEEDENGEGEDPNAASSRPETKEGDRKKDKKGKKKRGKEEAKVEVKLEEEEIPALSTIIPNPNDPTNDEGADAESGDKKDRIRRRNSWVAPHDEAAGSATRPTTRGSRPTTRGSGVDESNSKKVRRKKWDSSIRSPIFFGYFDTTVKEVLAEKKAERDATASAENRAIERAKETRSSMLDVVEKNAKAQEANRLSKIQEIEKRYKAANERREAELNKNINQLQGAALDAFQRVWDSDYLSAEKAFQAEVGALKYTNHQKTKEEQANLLKRRQEMEAFKDAEAQEMPAAERLEEISRIEISRWIEELNNRNEDLIQAKKEYQEMRDEFEFIMSKGPSQRQEKQLRELRSVVNFAESTVREKQSGLKDAIQSLEDAEALFDRAIRIRKQQDLLLPLFSILTREHTPSSCQVNLFVCALTLLMKGSYEEKWNLTCQIYDAKGLGYFSSVFFARVLTLFQETLYRLHVINFPPNETEINNTVSRMFSDLKLVPGEDRECDRLTPFEMRQVLKMISGKSELLAKLLGISDSNNAPGHHMTVFQRNKISCIAALLRGLTSPSDARYRMHYETVKYWSNLEPKGKQILHDSAMSMGEEDPLQPDYSRFMDKEKVKYSATIPPLKHGQFHYKPYEELRIQTTYATKILAMVRANHDRKVADLFAKRQAFLDAKEVALKEVKKKILAEFKKREAYSGIAKIKWDAQVRMKQAKLKTAGGNADRGNTIMIMMDELISKGQQDIQGRFDILMKDEDFNDVNLDGFVDKREKIMRLDKFYLRHFDVKGQKKTVNLGVIDDGTVGTDFMSHDDEIVLEEEAKEEVEDLNNLDVESDEEDKKGDDIIEYEADYNRLTSIVRAIDDLDGTGRGFTRLEEEMQLHMMNPDPEKHQLFMRLRAMDSTMTIFKVDGLLAEIPSKRLLIRYAEENTVETLAVDLKTHFRFTRDQMILAKMFKRLVRTDFERGLLYAQLTQMQEIYEFIIREGVRVELGKAVDQLSTMMDRKLISNEQLSEKEALDFEIERAEKFWLKFHEEATLHINTMEKQREELHRSLLSVKETKKKVLTARLLRNRKNGDLSEEVDPAIDAHVRQSWMKRLKNALGAPEANRREINVKYSEIRGVCQEFLDTATSDAMLLIAEYYREKYTQTLHVVKEMDVDGRGEIMGRGKKGKYYLYQMHDIEYTVCDDYNGVFDGSEEIAMKAGGKERLGALEYLKTHIHGLNVALTATIDYAGFRVVASSTVPTKHITFNDEGEIRKISEERVHGLTPDGNYFTNKNKRADNLLMQVSNKLNLTSSFVKGLRDPLGVETSASSEIQVYKGTDNEFYASNFWKAFPSECPEFTPHLWRSPRDQTVFWRQFRPEFCRQYDHGDLSPNALLWCTHKTQDSDKQDDEAREATKYLVDDLIPQLAENFAGRDFVLPIADGFGLNITEELHCRGVNIRHLGLLRSLFWRDLPGHVDMFFGEKRLKTEEDLGREVFDGDHVEVFDVKTDFVVKETEKRKIKPTSIPLSEPIMERSLPRLTARVGRLKNQNNSEDMRAVLLGEMMARTVKNLIRNKLRSYARKSGTVSRQMMKGMVTEYLNVITGSHPESQTRMEIVLYESIRHRFGPKSVFPSEKSRMANMIQPVLIYIVKRILTMLGTQLNPMCFTHFMENPLAFNFCDIDFIEVHPVVRHNMPQMIMAEAMLTSAKADELAENSFKTMVMNDEPVLYYEMNERKGSRACTNRGSLGKDFDGMFSRGLELWCPGPILPDPFSRSAYFTPENGGFLDIKFHEQLVQKSFHDHWTMEVFVYLTGGPDTNRIIWECGRHSLTVAKDGDLTFIFYDGLCSIALKLTPCLNDEWMHLMFTYDGQVLSTYSNGALVSSVEVEPLMHEQREVHDGEVREKKLKLTAKEDKDKEKVKEKTKAQADKYFMSKSGVAFLKSETQDIMETIEFQNLGIGDDMENEKEAIKARRAAALKQAKANYIGELYVKNVKDIKDRFAQSRQELEDRNEKRNEEGRIKMQRPLRIGAAHTDGNSSQPDHCFYGRISNLAIYSRCLNHDRVRLHYLFSKTDSLHDAQRMYGMASLKYEEALRVAPNDTFILEGFARSMVEYLKNETKSTFNEGVSKGKLKVMEIIERFESIGVPEGIAAILKALPMEAQYGDLIVKGFPAIKRLDRYFFSRHSTMNRADLVHVPHGFALDYPGNPSNYIAVAAQIYSEVIRDSNLTFAYGETDLGWLSDIESPELVVAVVRQAREDRNLKIVRVGDLFKSVGRTILNVTDHDVAIITTYASLSIGFDFGGCHLLTNASLTSLGRSSKIRVINMENCPLIDDSGIQYLLDVAETLESVNFGGAVHLTDEGLSPLFQACQRLTYVNLNKCVHVTFELIHVLALNNRKLSALNISGCHITDAGMSLICSAVSDKTMSHLDISFCRDISDYGAGSIAESMKNLKFINMCGLSRVSDKGARAVVAKCWYLEHINLEDVFLLSDDALNYDRDYDGRPLADEHMLTHIQSLNMRDCVNLTDAGIRGLSERCRTLEELILRGCDKLTDRSLELMANPFEYNFPLLDSIRVLDISFSTGFTTEAVLEALSHCGVIEDLRVSGLYSVDDAFLQMMCLKANTIQKLSLAKCGQITDAGLCSLADYLWVEKLDITGCRKVTDEGIELIAVICNGIIDLNVNGCSKVTARSINAIRRNCINLQVLDIRGCNLIKEQSILDLKKGMQHLDLKTEFD